MKASLIGSKEWSETFTQAEKTREYATGEDWKAFLPGVWDGIVERNTKMHETGKFEDFLNCITWGYTDFLKQQFLLTIENPTEYNVANLASLGIVGMINSAINPEKTGSPEQIMSIAGTATLAAGGAAGIAGKSVKVATPKTVYDLKTGSATLTQSRITQIQNAVNPLNPSSVTVIQIK